MGTRNNGGRVILALKQGLEPVEGQQNFDSNKALRLLASLLLHELVAAEVGVAEVELELLAQLLLCCAFHVD